MDYFFLGYLVVLAVVTVWGMIRNVDRFSR